MTGAALGAIRAGGIIAAGEGSRLRADGWSMSKPLVTVAGRPLIAHALDRMREGGIERICVIINEESADTRQWLKTHAGDLELIVRTTPSSYVSFRLVASRLAGRAAVVTTVDSIMPAESFRRFLAAAAEFPEGSFVLGLTDHVDDEKPLWATLEAGSGRITNLGDSNGGLVTAGIYVLPAHRPAEPATGFARLRDYLGWLVAQRHPVYGVVLPQVFDIDRGQDIAAAEKAAAGSQARSKGV
jgi:NDP-sugar pyrophosphorylase family protein